MASPKSSWTGMIQMGMFSIPVSVAPATVEQKEESLKDLCSCHQLPIDRSERCRKGGTDYQKVKGVQDSEGNWRKLNENEIANIEMATKSTTLEVVESQPIENLPVLFGTRAYFIRPATDNRAAATSYGILTEALAKSGNALVTKWCSRTRQKLVAIREYEGMLYMQVLPMPNELREPGALETAHKDIEVPGNAVEMTVQIINQYQPSEGFNHEAYEDIGLTMRRDAVDKVLAGDISEGEDLGMDEPQQVPDVMEMLEATMQEQKEESKA